MLKKFIGFTHLSNEVAKNNNYPVTGALYVSHLNVFSLLNLYVILDLQILEFPPMLSIFTSFAVIMYIKVR